ncbi:MAG: efflux RND transporter periplasmic adaptor subunit [Vicinamibacteria bacterium]|nr:efflux RND transporter periplasmic adaptor subunit [Vicinamibacteria bacterium]
MKRRRVAVIAVVVLAGVGGMMARNRGPQPTEVQLAKVGREDLQAKVSANGRVQAQKKVDISATIAGQVVALAVEEGDRVRKGQFLLQIDPVSSRANARSNELGRAALSRELESARAQAELAAADLERARSNHAAGIIPAADLERAGTAAATARASVQALERRVEQAGASLESAQDLVAKTTVRSPMDGIVTARRVEEGEVAVIGIQNSPGTVLLQISDMSVVETELEVDETSIPAVKVGQDARVRIDAYPNRTFEGVVTEVGSSPIQRSTGAATQNEAIKFLVKVQIQNPPEGIKPGLSVQADVLTGFRADALTVPIQALVLRDEESKPGEKRTGPRRELEGVYVVEDGKVAFREIQTGLLGEMSLEVTGGLKGGESIVTGPFRALRTLNPGDTVVEEKPKEPQG